MSPYDIVVLIGGGNMGTHYIWEEEKRRTVVQSFPLAPILSMPQTMFFEKS